MRSLLRLLPLLAAQMDKKDAHELDLYDIPVEFRGVSKLWLPYRPDIRVWYHAVFLLRRAVATILFVGLVNDILMRRAAMLAWMVVLLLLQIFYEPFVRARDNFLAVILLTVLAAVAGLALSSGSSTSLPSSAIVGLTVATLAVGVCVTAFLILHDRCVRNPQEDDLGDDDDDDGYDEDD